MSVLITRPIHPAGMELLSKAGIDFEVGHAASRAELIGQVSRYAGIISQLMDPMDAEVLQAAASGCRVVATCAVGYENIDVAAATKLGIFVTHTPDVLTESTADLAWALLMACARRLGEAERYVRVGRWQGWDMLGFLGADVYGQTLGIIGAGRIGSAVARRASGFSMKVVYVSRSESSAMQKLGAARVELPELLRQSDFISIHAPLNDQTRHLLNDDTFATMKPTAIVINTARGPVIDQAALIRALQQRRIRGAGLDVFDGEPAVPPELIAMENVVLLPHIGSATEGTRSEMARLAARNIISVLAGKGPITPVPGSRLS